MFLKRQPAPTDKVTTTGLLDSAPSAPSQIFRSAAVFVLISGECKVDKHNAACDDEKIKQTNDA